jgi:hypothetical protein
MIVPKKWSGRAFSAPMANPSLAKTFNNSFVSQLISSPFDEILALVLDSFQAFHGGLRTFVTLKVLSLDNIWVNSKDQNAKDNVFFFFLYMWKYTVHIHFVPNSYIQREAPFGGEI